MEDKELIKELKRVKSSMNRDVCGCIKIAIDEKLIGQIINRLEILDIFKNAFSKEVLEHMIADAYECIRISKEAYDLVKQWLEIEEIKKILEVVENE